LLGCLFCLLAAAPAQATSVEFGLNDTSAQLRLTQPLRSDELGQTLLQARALYSDQEETKLGSLALEFAGEPGNVPGFEVGVGAGGVFGKAHRGQDFVNLALGLRADYAPPVLGGLGFGGRLGVAPELLSFADSERFWEASGQIRYALTPKARVFVEYQNLRNRFEHRGTWTIDDALRVGFEARF
jgi:hypothetical protein